MNINRVELSLSELEQVSGGMPAFLESFTEVTCQTKCSFARVNAEK